MKAASHLRDSPAPSPTSAPYSQLTGIIYSLCLCPGPGVTAILFPSLAYPESSGCCGQTNHVTGGKTFRWANGMSLSDTTEAPKT